MTATNMCSNFSGKWDSPPLSCKFDYTLSFQHACRRVLVLKLIWLSCLCNGLTHAVLFQFWWNNGFQACLWWHGSHCCYDPLFAMSSLVGWNFESYSLSLISALINFATLIAVHCASSSMTSFFSKHRLHNDLICHVYKTDNSATHSTLQRMWIFGNGPAAFVSISWRYKQGQVHRLIYHLNIQLSKGAYTNLHHLLIY